MTDDAPTQDAPTDDRAALARAVVALQEWAHENAGRGSNPLPARLHEHLGTSSTGQSVHAGDAGDAGGAEDDDTPVVTREWSPVERVNLQLALDAWTAEPGRVVDVLGYTLPPHFGGLELGQLLHGTHVPPLRLSAPAVDDLPSGPRTTAAVWRCAVLLVTDPRGRYALHLRGPEPQHGQAGLTVEVAGLPTREAQSLLAELDAERSARNVYRGQVLELGAHDMGGVVISFPDLPQTGRDDVVLPEAVLSRVERHTLAVAARRDVLRASGQHLKRGLLLYGPPGTGKTHTTRYVVTHLPGTTVLLLSGRALHLVGAVTTMARELQPSVVVLEDVDLVAEDRSYGPGTNPVLFELLDAMDGSAADADLLFLLTTNRAEALERALAARPGRVDVALEIGLPDADCRRRLLDLYTRAVPLAPDVDDAALTRAVERTAGVTASFVKELVRRAVLEAAMDDDGADDATSPGPVLTVTAAHLERALDDLLDASQALTRALLGVPTDQSVPDHGDSQDDGPDDAARPALAWT